MHRGCIVTRARIFMEQRVGRQRPVRIDALGAEPSDGRRDDGAVFFAEHPVFAGMRIEPGDDQTRMRQTEATG